MRYLPLALILVLAGAVWTGSGRIATAAPHPAVSDHVSAPAQTTSGPALVNCDVPDSQLTQNSDEQSMLALVNAYRAQTSLPPYVLSPVLTRAAAWKATDLAATVAQGGAPNDDDASRTWTQRLHDCGYVGSDATAGEDIDGGLQSAADTLGQWKGSSNTHPNLVSTNFTVVGIKQVRASKTTDLYVWYWVMTFGTGSSQATTTAPPAPASVKATALSSSSIKIDWTAASTTDDGFVIFDALLQTLISTVPRGINSFTLSGLDPSAEYCVIIYATNASGQSDASAQVCATTLP